MLDTDTVIYALRGTGRVSRNLLEKKPSEVCISVITLAELRFGADRRASRKLHRLIDVFVRGVSVEPFDAAAAGRFGRLAAALVDAGTPIGNFDALIAAHSLALRTVLVTNNTKRFSQVRGLKIENWV